MIHRPPQIYRDSSPTDSRFLTNRGSNELPLYVTNSAFQITQLILSIGRYFFSKSARFLLRLKYQCFGEAGFNIEKIKTAPGPSLKKRYGGVQFGRATSIWANYYMYLEPICPLFWCLNPPKEGPLQSKQGSFRFQVYIYIYTYS